MDFTWTILLLIVALAIAGLGQIPSGQKNRGKRITFLWIGLLVAGLMVVNLITPVIPVLQNPVSFKANTFSQDIPKDLTPIAGECPDGFTLLDNKCKCLGVSSGTTVTLSSEDKYSSVASGGTHRYRLAGATAKTVSDGGTFTASPGQTLQVLLGNASLTSYFGRVKSFIVPCDTTYSPLEDDNTPLKTVGNGTLSITVYNRDGDAMSATVGETLVAGDNQAIKMKLQGTFEKEFPYGLVAVVETNKSQMDSVKLLTQGGIELATTAIPQTNLPVNGVDSVRTAYIVPEVIGSAEYFYQLNLDADNTINPESDMGNTTITFYPRNPFINEDEGGIFASASAEDEDNAVTRTGQFTYGVYII